MSAAVEAYFTDHGRVRATGDPIGERSVYGPFAKLLNAVGRRSSRQKVLCVGDTPVLGVAKAPLRPAFAAIAVPATTAGRHMPGEDSAVTSGMTAKGAP